MKKLLMIVMVAVLGQGCSKPVREGENQQKDITRPAAISAGNVQTAPPRQRPTIDPKSSEAAADALRSFVELLNERKFDEAYMLLGPGAPPRREFDAEFSRYSELRVTIGTPGDQEGAAGSIYLSIPLILWGYTKGERTRQSATAVLRRVNDVPGSSEAERHWHIEKIELGKAP